MQTLTLIGDPKLISIAEKYIYQLDRRQRQVALEVKILDINLKDEDGFDNSNFFRTKSLYIVNNKGLADITSDYTKNKPEVQLVIDENKAKDLGLSIQAIGKSIETLFSGKSVTTLNEGGKEYPIIVQQYLSDRRNKEGVSKIFVRSETNLSLIHI